MGKTNIEDTHACTTNINIYTHAHTHPWKHAQGERNGRVGEGGKRGTHAHARRTMGGKVDGVAGEGGGGGVGRLAHTHTHTLSRRERTRAKGDSPRLSICPVSTAVVSGHRRSSPSTPMYVYVYIHPSLEDSALLCTDDRRGCVGEVRELCRRERQWWCGRLEPTAAVAIGNADRVQPLRLAQGVSRCRPRCHATDFPQRCACCG